MHFRWAALKVKEVDMTNDEMVKAVRKHATANYEQDGWDYLVECYSDDEIVELFDGATTVEEAIANVGEVMKLKDDYRKDIEATAF